jgi:hypothetical protein
MRVHNRHMSADFQRRVGLGLILLLVLFGSAALSGCATADKGSANFAKAQKLRQRALIADSQGNTASALDDLNRVRVLEPVDLNSPGLIPPPMSGPEHRAIAPASGQTTCNNIGINRFSCF